MIGTDDDLPPATTPSRKPLYRRPYPWITVAAVIGIGAAATAIGGGIGITRSPSSQPSAAAQAPAGVQPGQPAPSTAPRSGSEEGVPTGGPGPVPAQQSGSRGSGPLSDGGWALSQILTAYSSRGTAIEAQVVNTRDQPRSGTFTLTILGPDGARLRQTHGSAPDVAAGATVTVTFVAATDPLPGDPAGYTYQFHADD